MNGALRDPQSLLAQTQPFLFQPYSSGDDGDSPPSLTHSSESPRSTSEEGGNIASGPSTGSVAPSPHLIGQPFAASSKRDAGMPSAALAQSRRTMKAELGPHAASFTGMMYESEEAADEAQRFASANGAMSPNWDAVFGADSGVLATSDTADAGGAGKPLAGSAQHTSRPALNEATAGPQPTQPAWVAGVSKWQQQQNGSHRANAVADDDAKMNDDALFASMIQEDSFDDSSSKDVSSTSGSDHSSSKMDVSFSTAANSQATTSVGAGQTSPTQSTKQPASQLSSRRSSIDQDLGSLSSKVAARIPHSGSHYSHTSDADLPSSSQIIVRPGFEELNGLQVHVHGIAASGAKSRVETQIRLRLELVRTAPQASTSTGFERIGTFNHIKLPPMTGTKRRSKKHRPTDINAERTLFMDAAVVRATPPHERVYVCRSCQQREKKRAQRRKTASRREDGKGHDEDQFSLEDMQELGVDPKAPDAQAKARLRTEQEDERRVVVFNCGDFVAFEEGTCILPTRITCYCRHHREKTGFCLVFTMRNFRGEVVATGSTPPIMITDDHKSVGAASSNNTGKKAEASASRSRAQSSELGVAPAIEQRAPPRTVSGDTAKTKRRQNRAKPYGDAEERGAARRSTVSSTVSATPHALSTGQNTPAVALSPSSTSDFNQPDFWNAFASMSNIVSTHSPAEASRSSIGAQTPLEITSPSAVPMSSQSVVSPMDNGMSNWINDTAAQGSLSAQTLNLAPQSLPGFDMQAFMQSLQRSHMQGDEASLQQLMMLARSMPTTTLNGFGSMMPLQRNGLPQDLAASPQPAISKLIPGEGPTSGGIEVTVLGENFEEGQTCFFGDVPATSTRVWGSNTLLCILPPSASPGPVAVTVKGSGSSEQMSPEQQNRTLQLFTYTDTTDRALMELALQVVGLQMTGQMQSARDVAMRVVGSGPNQGMTRTQGSNGQGGSQHSHNSASRDAVTGVFSGSSGVTSSSFQDSVLGFLQMLDVDLEATYPQRRDAIRLANKQGHTLLHLSVILGLHRLASDLIRRGCPVNARDHTGMTALHFCALRGRVNLARLLLSHGAIANVESEAGKTPLDIALEEEQPDVESLLDVAVEEADISASSSEEVDDEDEVEEIESDIDDDEPVSLLDENLVIEESAHTFAPLAQGKVLSTDDEKMLSSLSAPKSVTFSDQKIPSKTPTTSEKAADMHNKENDAAGVLRALVNNSLDLATRARLGVPMVLHEGFNNLQMPVISVFQMALPHGLANWAFLTDSSAADAEGSAEGSSSKAIRSDAAEPVSPWRNNASRLRNIVEESTLWINPLSTPPPPAYEESQSARAPSGSTLTHRKRPSTSLRDGAAQASTSAHTLTSTDAAPAIVKAGKTHSRSTSASGTGTSATPAAAAALTTVRHNHLRDDRMLVYFWLPILVFVVLLLFFAKPSSVLSYEDLRSFIPVA